MAGELAPAPKVDDEPIATIVRGWWAEIRPATRSSGVSKRAKPGGATQASVGATLCALAELTAAVAMVAISVAAIRKKMAILSLLKKITTCFF
jgi:hypothetical protein